MSCGQDVIVGVGEHEQQSFAGFQISIDLRAGRRSSNWHIGARSVLILNYTDYLTAEEKHGKSKIRTHDLQVDQIERNCIVYIFLN